MKNYDCVIIGAGVAGMTAAIYLKRAGLDFIVLENGVPGGQINKSSNIENYPGFKKVDGPTLAFNIYEQIENLGVVYKYGDVKEIKDSDNHKVVCTDQEEYITKTIIIATGRKPRELGLDNEKKLLGSGISYCAYCDGMLYKNKDVIIIGGGNSALEEALYIADIANKVYIVHRSSEYRADEVLIDKVNKKENIIKYFNKEVIEILENEDKFSGVRLNDNSVINADGLFIYIGQIPETNFITNIEKTKDGYIVTDSHLKTTVDKIYACGDVLIIDLYQIASSSGEGALAASNVIKILK